MASNNSLRQNMRTSNKGARMNEIIKEIISWILVFATAFAIAWVLNKFVIINANVPSGSMENTIMTGDRMIGNRLAYLKNGPKRGDIVIFRYPDDESRLFVKRVIGLPGETVQISGGHIYITNRQDGTTDGLYEENYLKETWEINNDGYVFEIPEDSYLMLGDNRNTSNDARLWTNTYVKKEKIEAKAWFVYYPFKNAKFVSKK